MNILFTKQVERKTVAEKLGPAFKCDFTEVISIHHLTVEPFDLKDKSLIFSSVNGVKSFFQNNFRPVQEFTDPNFNKIFAVGSKTKAELRRHGFGTFKVLPHAADLAEFITRHFSKERFLHFCGNLALDILDKKLPLQNISYRKIPVYRTELLYPTIARPYDGVVFFSPSGVRSFVKNNSVAGLSKFSIGYTTEKELRKYTTEDIVTSEKSNLNDLLDLIMNAYQQPESQPSLI